MFIKHPNFSAISLDVVRPKTYLDLSIVLCYNIGVEREGKPKRSPTRASKTFPTKTLTARCFGVRDINVNQCPVAEVIGDYAEYNAVFQKDRK